MAEAPTLRLYNTLTRAKEDFVPLDPANVRMYVCGPTVYDFAHIGNARPVIVFDVLYRLLRHLYGPEHVTYVRNITDIDDKINKRAFERWTRKRPLLAEMRELTEGTTAQYEADVAALGCLPPTHAPRATDFVCDGAKPMDMVRVIEKLVARGHAYAAEGHVLFHVPSMPNYGRLSRRPLDEMVAGARVEVAPYKRDPMDFVLWKPSDPATEPGWDSPWGFGRPGWHIECSAMSGALLGETFDIHAGGIDLIFPHHENEIAQSCCAFGVEKMASVWMHNGFLQVEGQKMSKSLGNFVTIREVLNDWPGEVVRLNMLKTHYRQPIDWTVRGLEESERQLSKWTKELARDKLNFLRNFESPYKFQSWADADFPTEVSIALSDDLNFSEAIRIIEDFSKAAASGDEEARLKLLVTLSALGVVKRSTVAALADRVEMESGTPWMRIASDVRAYKIAVCNGDNLRALGIFNRLRADGLTIEHDDAGGIFISGQDGGANLIASLLKDRLEARRAKNFAESDRIRDELAAMGIQLKDGKDPVTGEPVTTWEVKR